MSSFLKYKTFKEHHYLITKSFEFSMILVNTDAKINYLLFSLIMSLVPKEMNEIVFEFIFPIY